MLVAREEEEEEEEMTTRATYGGKISLIVDLPQQFFFFAVVFRHISVYFLLCGRLNNRSGKTQKTKQIKDDEKV